MRLLFLSVGVDGEVMVGLGGAKTELMSPEESEELFMSKAQTKSRRIDRPEDLE